MLRAALTWVVVGLAAVAVVQFVPYVRAELNPPVRGEPAWDSGHTRELISRACFDCHSNETRWPWYSHVAPASWLVHRDVVTGRRKLNFSEWDRPQEEAGESVEAVQKGEMPPWYYPWARLPAADRVALIRGLSASLGDTRKHRDD